MLQCLGHTPHESAIIVTDNKGYLTFLDDESLIMKKRIKLSEDYGTPSGIGVLSDGRLVLSTKPFKPVAGETPGTSSDLFSPPETKKQAIKGLNIIGIYDREGIRLKKLTNYGDSKRLKVVLPCHIKVLPNDVIAVAMQNSSRVVYFTADLQSLQVVDTITWPKGLTVSPQGDVILVAGHGQRHLHRLWGTVGSVKAEMGMEFPEHFCVTSVAMQDNLLAVASETALHLYQWQG